MKGVDGLFDDSEYDALCVEVNIPNLIANNSASGTPIFPAATLDGEMCWPSFQL